MLSHVNKRVRGHDQIKLPLNALLDLYLTDASTPLVKNFAIVYVEMAMERSTEDQQAAAVSMDSCTCVLSRRCLAQSITTCRLHILTLLRLSFEETKAPGSIR